MWYEFGSVVRSYMGGAPCLENTCSMNSFVRLAKVTVLWVGMNIACFVRWSTTTKIVVYPDDFGSCSMKSMDIEFQGCSGIGSCLSKPYGQWGCDLEHIQVIQDLQKSVTKFWNPGHVYSCWTDARVLFWPKCPKRMWLCLYYSTLSCRFLVSRT